MNAAPHESDACPLCQGTDARLFYELDGVPVTCTSIFPSASLARAVPCGRIALAVCRRCGFAFNRAFDAALGEIGAQYESSQAASAHFSAFARSLAAEWVERHGLVDRRVLEVGSGGGGFLELLIAAGVERAMGIDPLATPVAGSNSNAISVIADRFGTHYLGLDAAALVCRHTLEHIADPAGFLALLAMWAVQDPQRVILIEVPDAERVFAERAFWDVYYEHCNYFTAATLRFGLEEAGLEVTRLERVYGDQYLIAEARSRHAAGHAKPCEPADRAAARCLEFAAEVRTAITRGQAALDRLAAPCPVVLWQGAAKTVGFLSALPDPSVIDSAIDASPARQGKFLPGSALAVHSPAQLMSMRLGHIVLMNPVYLAEVTAQVRALGLDTPVHSVNDLLHGN